MTASRDLTADGIRIVTKGTPEQAMRFLAGIYCEHPEETDSISDCHIWSQIPAELCGELVALALKRKPTRYNEDRTLVEIVYLRKQEDPDGADWKALDLPNVQEHVRAITRQAMQHHDLPQTRSLFAPRNDEYVDPDLLLPEEIDGEEADHEDDELEILNESGLGDSNVIDFPDRPRRRLAVVPDIG